MFFPIGDANIKHGHKAFFTYLIIAANIAVFAMQFMMPNDLQQRFVMDYGCIPNELMQFKQWHTVITSMFLHGGVMHLLGNMLFMWVFADNIEATIGNFKFLLFYLAGGVVATLTHVFFNAGSEVPCVGASGAIAACLGAYLVMFPHSKIKIFFIIFLTTFNVSAIYFLGFWIVQQFMSGMGSIGVATAGVAYWAHIGGFVFGVCGGFFYRAQAKKMTFHP
jgi:membrane associated rhomboid family serine protease